MSEKVVGNLIIIGGAEDKVGDKEILKKVVSYINKEKDMILTHMFPVTPRPPRYIESWIVGATDKCVSICEVFHSRKAKVLSYMNVIAIVMLNFIWK